jgi:hypothetical protein
MHFGQIGWVPKDKFIHHIFQLVCGIDVIFPVHLGIPIMKILEETQEKPNDMQRIINQLI